MADDGVPVHELQLLAGHSSITTTQRYMNARARSLAESMRQARERRVNRVELSADDHRFATRYLIACDALSTTQARFAFAVFERAFKDFGLPLAIRTDNGGPFAAPTALYRLSKRAVWWLRLGNYIERIAPGHPQQTVGMSACI